MLTQSKPTYIDWINEVNGFLIKAGQPPVDEAEPEYELDFAIGFSALEVAYRLLGIPIQRRPSSWSLKELLDDPMWATLAQQPPIENQVGLLFTCPESGLTYGLYCNNVRFGELVADLAENGTMTTARFIEFGGKLITS